MPAGGPVGRNRRTRPGRSLPVSGELTTATGSPRACASASSAAIPGRSCQLAACRASVYRRDSTAAGGQRLDHSLLRHRRYPGRDQHLPYHAGEFDLPVRQVWAVGEHATEVQQQGARGGKHGSIMAWATPAPAVG